VRDQRVLEVASVAGIEFSAAQIVAALPSGASDRSDRVEAHCEELARHTPFLDSRGVAHWPDGTIAARYAFRHSLHREVLYGRLGPVRRSHTHQRVGRRMETAYQDRTDEIAGELAVHFEHGGDFYRSAKYLARSAEIALSRSAGHEAIAAAKKGLALLKSVGDGAPSRQQELRLQIILGTALMAQFGFGAPATARAYSRAGELIEQLREAPALAPVLLGIAKFHIVRKELSQAQDLTEQSLRLAQDGDDAALALAAHATLAAISYDRGQFTDCLSHANQALQLHDLRKSQSDAVVYGLDSAVVARIYAGLSLWMMGFPDQARSQTRQAVARGQELGHSHTWSMALAAEASVRAFCRDWSALHRCAEELNSLTAEKEIRFWHAWATFYRGQVLAGQGELAEGLALMRQANAKLEASGADSSRGQLFCLAAELSARSANPQAGLRLVSDAFTMAHQTGYRLDEAEWHRLAGVLTLGCHGRRYGRPSAAEAYAKAEACFLRAIETSRNQGAKSYELRAIMDLCRLWCRQGKTEAARRILSEAYNWFTEGFNTGDLKEARSLLAQPAS
jgi:predicted ATPase